MAAILGTGGSRRDSGVISRWARRALVGLGTTVLVADGGLRQDEIDCEQAVSYLEGCCPDLLPSSVWCIHDTGCFTSVAPEISIAESHCIVATSCEDAIARGVCSRVSALPQPSRDANGDEVTPSHAPVCP